MGFTPSYRNGPLFLIESSGIASCRSLNSYCHLVRESLIAMGVGSKYESSDSGGSCGDSYWMVVITGCSGWENTEESGTKESLSARTKACWAKLGYKDYLHVSLILVTTLFRRDTEGNAYKFKSSQARFNASTTYPTPKFLQH